MKCGYSFLACGPGPHTKTRPRDPQAMERILGWFPQSLTPRPHKKDLAVDVSDCGSHGHVLVLYGRSASLHPPIQTKTMTMRTNQGKALTFHMFRPLSLKTSGA